MRRRQNMGLKLLQSVNYEVEHAKHGVLIEESVKQWKAATTPRPPASSSGAALSQRVGNKIPHQSV